MKNMKEADRHMKNSKAEYYAEFDLIYVAVIK